jgi:chromosome segregation ATPase
MSEMPPPEAPERVPTPGETAEPIQDAAVREAAVQDEQNALDDAIQQAQLAHLTQRAVALNVEARTARQRAADLEAELEEVRAALAEAQAELASLRADDPPAG